MTKVVQLDPVEWKALALTNVGQLHAFYSGIEAPSQKDLSTISAHLDRMKAFAQAWHLSQRPQIQVQQPEAERQVPVVSDPKLIRKGGWPKGKKRMRNGAGTNAEV